MLTSLFTGKDECKRVIRKPEDIKAWHLKASHLEGTKLTFSVLSWHHRCSFRLQSAQWAREVQLREVWQTQQSSLWSALQVCLSSQKRSCLTSHASWSPMPGLQWPSMIDAQCRGLTWMLSDLQLILLPWLLSQAWSMFASDASAVYYSKFNWALNIITPSSRWLEFVHQ